MDHVPELRSVNEGDGEFDTVVDSDCEGLRDAVGLAEADVVGVADADGDNDIESFLVADAVPLPDTVSDTVWDKFAVVLRELDWEDATESLPVLVREAPLCETVKETEVVVLVVVLALLVAL